MTEENQPTASPTLEKVHEPRTQDRGEEQARGAAPRVQERAAAVAGACGSGEGLRRPHTDAASGKMCLGAYRLYSAFCNLELSVSGISIILSQSDTKLF